MQCLFLFANPTTTCDAILSVGHIVSTIELHKCTCSTLCAEKLMDVEWCLMVSGMHLESKTRRRGMQGLDLQSISNLHSRILEKGV